MVKLKPKPAKTLKRPSRSSETSLKKAQAMARARHAKSLEFAKKHRPPQSWFDQTDLPFIPTQH